MFVADVKCSQATWQTVPNSRTGSAKASVFCLSNIDTFSITKKKTNELRKVGLS